MNQFIDDVLAELDEESDEPTYPQRLKYLKGLGRDTSQIEGGVSSTVSVLEDGARSFVIYGEPQSGKTEFMIALTCKLVDLGYQTIFVVMNDNTELEAQNFDRFHAASQLNPTPVRDFQLQELSDKDLKLTKTRIIFCRKNSKNLQKLIDHCRHMTGRIVIDDEADFATPNTKINKAEATAINQHLGDLADLGPGGEGTYIGVTATPGRLDLNNTFLNKSANWVFLDPYPDYKGRSFFFPVSIEDKTRSDYQLVRLPDDTDDPRLLRHAIFRFLLRVALLNSEEGSDQTAYSMLIHTAGKTNDHLQDQKDVNDILTVLANKDDSKRIKYLDEMAKLAAPIAKDGNEATVKRLMLFVLKNIGRHEVLVINHKNDKGNVQRAGKPRALFTFAIGGNIVSRGLTFERLLTFYFSRNVKGRMQQNTYIQRARMFGNRPYSEHFELCVPETLFQDWADCFQDHELSLRLAKSGAYAHVQSKKNAAADNAAIDKANVVVENSERTVGETFPVSPELEKLIITSGQAATISFIRDLIASGDIPGDAFSEAVLNYIFETAEVDESDVFMVLKRDKNGISMQNITNYADGVEETILRPRGGVIHAMLNKREEYAIHKHFILPIKNNQGEMRFLYKSKFGHTIIQNVRHERAVA